MSVLAPPKPPPPHEDPEALIEEARRRAQRRRWKYATGAVLAVALVGGVLAAIALTGGIGSSTGGAPKGFHLVRARGPVAHARIEEYEWGKQPSVTERGTGRQRLVSVFFDVWWDRRSNLVRAVTRIDGRVQSDTVGQACRTVPGSGQACFPPHPFDLQNGFRWPLDPTVARVVGTGMFRGHRVTWVHGRGTLSNWGQVALDARTHQPVGTQAIYKGQVFDEMAYKFLEDVPRTRFSFVVPDGGAAPNAFPFPAPASWNPKMSSLSAVRDVLGTDALWLGPRFRGRRLRSVEVSTVGTRAANGSVAGHAKVVSFIYGNVGLDEYGGERPFAEQNPRAGKIVIWREWARFGHRSLLVVADLSRLFRWRSNSRGFAKNYADARRNALAVAKALRPVPSG
jgi:hypothetical protein